MPLSEKRQKKAAYCQRLINLFDTYPRILIVKADHVGSKQMSNIRYALRNHASLLMGKNTMIRSVLKTYMKRAPIFEKLMPLIKLNIGLIFCYNDFEVVQRVIDENRAPAPARQGVIAPVDVFVPPGATGMDPSQTSFFQALGISTKIVKGQIEIQSEVHIVKKDEKVSASAATLLQKLNIRPFSYALNIVDVFDEGSVYSADILSISPEAVIKKFTAGVTNVAALCRAIGFTTEASISHVVIEAFKNSLALVIDSEFSFKELEEMKEGASKAQAVSVTTDAVAAKADEAKKEESEDESEEDEDMGFSLFG